MSVQCPACEFVFDAKVLVTPTHVYRVLVTLGSGDKKWLYSEPTTKAEAKRNVNDLHVTGHKVELLTIADATVAKAQDAVDLTATRRKRAPAKPKKKRRRG